MIQTVVSLVTFMLVGALGFLQFDGALILSPIGHVILLSLIVIAYIAVRMLEADIRLATNRLFFVALSMELVVFLSNLVYEVWVFDKFLSSSFMMKLSMVLLVFPTILVNIIVFGLMQGDKKKKLEHDRVKKEKDAPIRKLLSGMKKSDSKQDKTKDVYFVLGVSADNADDE